MQDQPVPQPQQTQVDITVVQGSTKIVCVLGGKYLGSLTVEAASLEALGPLVQVFQQYVAQMRGGIQVSNGAGIPGLRTP